MPTNLYGAGDNFDRQSSHVLPALIRKFHEAKLADASAVVRHYENIHSLGIGGTAALVPPYLGL